MTHVLGAREHNLKDISVDIPMNRVTVVTGVSGSGKSSLVYDTIFRDAERRFSGAFGSLTRRGIAEITRPDVDDIKGLIPAIGLSARQSAGSVRSTVGTITEILDGLRVIFAKAANWRGDGEPENPLLSSHFSFNHPLGACPACQGHGVVDRVDPALIVADPTKSIADRCLVPTTPNGYIMYSQVTLSVLNEVCEAHGFNITIPWRDLTDEQRHVVLYGSDRVKVLFGKHPLENRLKWKGITAKPREEGHYKGIVPVMETILARERNDSIMRFAVSAPCPECQGSRLNPRSLGWRIKDQHIGDVTRLSLDDFRQWVASRPWRRDRDDLLRQVIADITGRLDALNRLGIGYLSLSRDSTTLSSGEIQRLKLASQLSADLSGVLYVLDEPSVGLHARDRQRLMDVLRDLRDQGNTVLAVEHDESMIDQADHVIVLGPRSGRDGGSVTWSGPPAHRPRPTNTIAPRSQATSPSPRPQAFLHVRAARANNLKSIDARFLPVALNVVTGVSGAGKSSLVMTTIGHRQRPTSQPAIFDGFDHFKQTITIDQQPMGRGSRSNPATYTKLLDALRDLFASLPDAQSRDLTKSHFSFNVAGGRCETCEGSGVEELGLHFMGMVESVCPACDGRRFHDDVLSVKLDGHSIADILSLTVDEAIAFFAARPSTPKPILRTLDALHQVGVGYLTLGQSSNTLSGGEAQRVKIASELCRPALGPTLYLLDEPTRGLHATDVARLLACLRQLIALGHTVIVIEHHLDVIRSADWIVDLGPEGGDAGGHLVVQGTLDDVRDCVESHTAKAIGDIEDGRSGVHCSQGTGVSVTRTTVAKRAPWMAPARERPPGTEPPGSTILDVADYGPAWGDSSPASPASIQLTGVRTGNLKGIDVHFPKNRLTAITGVSGAGKSSLAFDTLYAEGQNRFTRHFGSRARRHLATPTDTILDYAKGLSPTMGLDAPKSNRQPRSTVGTVSQIHDYLRLLYSRFATWDGPTPASRTLSVFSFNRPQGACPDCRGLGHAESIDINRIIARPDQPLLDDNASALVNNKAVRFYADPDGQFIAILRHVARHHHINLNTPWRDLTRDHQTIVLDGTGDAAYDVTWSFRRGKRVGEHHLNTRWIGLRGLLMEEYDRKRGSDRAESIEDLITTTPCAACAGSRLAPWAREARLANITFGSMASVVAEDLPSILERLGAWTPPDQTDLYHQALRRLSPEIKDRAELLRDVGLGHLALGRGVSTLSSGEARRLAIACHCGSRLSGVTYVMDEPTAGLHADNARDLTRVFRRMTDAGNTLVLVEHQLDVIAAADHVIDLGPGSGQAGGNVVAHGTPADIAQHPTSLTGLALKRRHDTIATTQFPPPNTPLFGVTGAIANNLRSVDISLPTRRLIAVTGVSGSGKSSLVNDVIAPSFRVGTPCSCATIHGHHLFSTVITSGDDGDTLPIGNVGHALGLWTGIIGRKIADHHCPDCRGTAHRTEGLGFLGDVSIPCESCDGLGYAPSSFTVNFHGVSLDRWTRDSVSNLADHIPQSSRPTASLMIDLGLGGLALGQSTRTLSSGERRRLKLITALRDLPSRFHKDHAPLLLLDEPSRGLHETEIPTLVRLLRGLVDRGASVIVIDHRHALTRHADLTVQMGPGAGIHGGQVL